MMKETPVSFGPESSLVGVVSTPGEEGRMAPIACLMLNMGATYRVGPHRINVKLARRMAALGISSIRFDLSGLGDSGSPAGGKDLMSQVILDIQAAMNLVETMLGIRRFIVIGLCSGATNGMAAAVLDPRVVGILMFDSYQFPDWRTRLDLSVRRALAAPINPAIFGKTVRWVERKVSAKAAAEYATINFLSSAPQAEVEAVFDRSMQTLVGRGVSLFFLYTGTAHVRDRGRDQLGRFAAAPYANHIDYRFIGELDHSLTSLASQITFVTVVCEWALRVVKGGTPAQPRPVGEKRIESTAESEPTSPDELRGSPVH
ncbi:MAG: alpha/beta hydrolase family protein [Variovorax sp.]